MQKFTPAVESRHAIELRMALASAYESARNGQKTAQTVEISTEFEKIKNSLDVLISSSGVLLGNILRGGKN